MSSWPYQSNSTSLFYRWTSQITNTGHVNPKTCFLHEKLSSIHVSMVGLWSQCSASQVHQPKVPNSPTWIPRFGATYDISQEKLYVQEHRIKRSKKGTKYCNYFASDGQRDITGRSRTVTPSRQDHRLILWLTPPPCSYGTLPAPPPSLAVDGVGVIALPSWSRWCILAIVTVSWSQLPLLIAHFLSHCNLFHSNSSRPIKVEKPRMPSGRAVELPKSREVVDWKQRISAWPDRFCHVMSSCGFFSSLTLSFLWY